MVKKNMRLTNLVWIVMIVSTLSLVGAHHENLPQGTHVMPDGTVMKNSDMVSQKSTQASQIGYFIGGLIVLVVIIWLYKIFKKKN